MDGGKARLYQMKGSLMVLEVGGQWYRLFEVSRRDEAERFFTRYTPVLTLLFGKEYTGSPHKDGTGPSYKTGAGPSYPPYKEVTSGAGPSRLDCQDSCGDRGRQQAPNADTTCTALQRATDALREHPEWCVAHVAAAAGLATPFSKPDIRLYAEAASSSLFKHRYYFC